MLKLKHLNHYVSKLSSTLLTADTDCSVDTLPPALATGYRYRMQLQDEDPFGTVAPVNIEIVDVIAVGATLTLNRAVEDATYHPARDWTVDPGIADVWLVSVDTAENLDNPNGIVIVRYAEKVAPATGSGTMDRSAGGIVPLTLTADTAIVWDLSEGESQRVLLTPGSWGITDYGGQLMTDAPTLATKNMIVGENIGGVIYVWAAGSYTA